MRHTLTLTVDIDGEKKNDGHFLRFFFASCEWITLELISGHLLYFQMDEIKERNFSLNC